MKVDAEVIAHLNDILDNERTAINHGVRHARRPKDRGLEQLGQREPGAAVNEMKRAGKANDRHSPMEPGPAS